MNPLFDLLPCLIELMTDQFLLGPGKLPLLEQDLHVVAVSFGRRDAPGGGMRLNHISLLLELGHLTANSRRANPQAAITRHALGGDGVSRGRVFLNQALEYSTPSFSQHIDS